MPAFFTAFGSFVMELLTLPLFIWLAAVITAAFLLYVIYDLIGGLDR